MKAYRRTRLRARPVAAGALATAGVVIGSLLMPVQPAAARPAEPVGIQACPPEDGYGAVKNKGDSFTQIGPTLALNNTAPETNKLKTTSKVSGTVSFAATGSGKMQSKVIMNSVEATLGISVTFTLVVDVGMEAEANVPGKSTRLIKFGVTRKKTTGTYSKLLPSCKTQSFVADALNPFWIGYKIQVG